MRYADAPVALQTRRVLSVDAVRGFSIFWIIGADGAVIALERMLRGKGPVLSTVGEFLGTQITHSDWEGFRFYDFIFPLFIFITGVSIVLALPRLVEREGRAKAHLRVLRRALFLYVLGIVYYSGFSLSDIRFVGILQRIAVCYLFASVLFLNLDWRGLVGAVIALLVGYWALLTFVPMPGLGAASYQPETNLANWVDLHYLPGRLWDDTRDPEGLLSTLPAIGTCVLGVLAGLLLENQRIPPAQKTSWLIAGGIAMVAAGYLWGLQFPIIKAIWTSSFVLIVGGYSMILLAVSHQVIDVWEWKSWAMPFVWIGANAILLYFLNGIIGFAPLAFRLIGGDVALWISSVTTSGTGAFVGHMLGLAFAIALAWFLYHRRIFLRV